MADDGSGFDEREEFRPTDTGYAVTTATFDATVRPDGNRCSITVEAPTLDAAVADEEVADTVEDGWFETLDRRLADAGDVAVAGTVDPPSADRRTGEDGARRVVVETGFDDSPDPASDALALVNYVEGTWFQGVVPGYEYVDEVEAVRERARRQDDSTPP